MSNELKTKLAYQRFEAVSKDAEPDKDKEKERDKTFRFAEGIPEWQVSCYNLLAWSWEVLAESREMAAKVWKVSHFEQVLSRLYLEGGRERCRAWVHENQAAITDLGLQELCRAAYLNIVK